ncbi:uncharacterized protein TRIADDRAFT_55379 [Trichoplax adhaerens]|uniref:Uncharacterized protein n=1 Tax=Trichoplax adhaerens TaxID=10228 RepID=B3RUR0_TRIAD|nr:hypothetical protein TRIADDRAFT_55379 [Trichoplax adhaerens]EDV25864.1 hypothetical protein TRIADDRAFT_55379 [Trichoplax adhaerens]|eukprot:XP_002111897.1 hypothetical protein TRIADDRAFT_55379 [Trichoplax adhaerens]
MPAMGTIFFTLIVVLLMGIPCMQCRKYACDDYCSIAVSSSKDVRNLKIKSSLPSIHVLFLSLLDVYNRTLFQPEDHTVFAWVRLDFGPSLMTIPVDLFILSSVLPLFFEDSMNVTIDQFPMGCYRNITNKAQRDLCTFTALKQFANIQSSCVGKTCGTICKRLINISTPLDDITFACCRILSNNETCDIPYSISPFLVAFRYVSIFLSVIFAAGAIKWFIHDIPNVHW